MPPSQIDTIATVTAATNATPIVITASAVHGLADAAEVKIGDVAGNPAANGSFYVKTSGYPADTFALYTDSTLQMPVPGSGAYNSGGAIYRPRPDDYAIVVAINRYPAFPALQGPEADAARFADWLRSPQGGNLALRNVKTIFSPNPQAQAPADATPRLDAVKTVFREHWEKVVAAKKSKRIGRRLYVFLSGHGITPNKAESANLDDAALLMADSTLGILDGHVLGWAWANRFRNAAAFDEIVLLMDCCRDLKDNVSPTTAPFLPEIISDERDSVKFFYARAAELDSKAWEQPMGNPPEHRGVFSYVLMNALQNESVRDGQGRLTTAVLAEHLRSEVPKIRADQQPVISGVSSYFDITLVERQRPSRNNLHISFAPSLQGRTAELFVAENPDVPIDSHTVNGGNWELSVSRSYYKLTMAGVPDFLFDSKPDADAEVKDVNFPA